MIAHRLRKGPEWIPGSLEVVPALGGVVEIADFADCFEHFSEGPRSDPSKVSLEL